MADTTNDPHSDPGAAAAQAGFITAFNVIFAGVLWLAGRSRRPLAERVSAEDVVLVGVATHKVSRLLTKSKVTAPLRAPFTEVEGPGGPGELEERSRGRGVRRAIGQLLTCPYCVGAWIAAVMHYGLVFAPRGTRLAGSIFASLTLADFLQAAYVLATARAQKSGEDERPSARAPHELPPRPAFAA